MVRKVLEYSF